jgi:hypothetical protein
MITKTKIALVTALVLGSTSLAFAQDRAHATPSDPSTTTHYAQIRDGSWTPISYEGGDWTRAGGAYRPNW